MNKRLELMEKHGETVNRMVEWRKRHYFPETGKWDDPVSRIEYERLCSREVSLMRAIIAEEHAEGEDTHQCEKPPIGIEPKYVWDRRRMIDILDAMKRYAQAEMRIPEEWIDELIDLLRSKEG